MIFFFFESSSYLHTLVKLFNLTKKIDFQSFILQNINKYHKCDLFKLFCYICIVAISKNNLFIEKTFWYLFKTERAFCRYHFFLNLRSLKTPQNIWNNIEIIHPSVLKYKLKTLLDIFGFNYGLCYHRPLA